MDKIVKKYLNDIFINNFSHLYKSKPTLKQVDNSNYYYIIADKSKYISLIHLDIEDEK